MTMYVLVVEDDAEFVAEVSQVLTELPGDTDIKVAGSRTAAMDLLGREFFDLVILDLKIPTIDGALDADPEHGHAVFAHARTVAPGTPVFVLTGSPAEDFIPALLKQQQQVDVWSEGRKVGTIDFLKKYKFDECPTMLEPIAAAVHGLSDVELDRGGADLTVQDDRLIRIFARKFGGTRCRVSQLGGGLSGAKVVRLRITNSGGARVHDAVAKLGSPKDVRDEANRFDNLVSRLDPAATPRKLAMLEFGAGALAGIFYGLAEGFESSAFDLALCQDGRAMAAINGVDAATRRWAYGVAETRRTVRDVRRRVLGDDAQSTILARYAINWANAFESVHVQTRWASIHGDLHGSNILIAGNGAAVLIDYGDIGDGPTSLDPITLELSLLFHPHRINLGGWPSLDQARNWGSLDAYLEGCPAAEFVRECRQWANRVSAGNREIAASAYGYLLRQLKYEDTNKELVLALLEGVKAFYDAT
jgi:CheY-like chemotaxis protein